MRTGPPVDDDEPTSPRAAGGPASSRSAPSSTSRSPAPCCPRAPRPRRTSWPADGTPCRRAGELTSSRVRKTAVYPPLRRLDVVDVLHGHRVADPYRWLEDPADERTRRLVARAGRAGPRRTSTRCPAATRLAARLHALLDAGLGRRRRSGGRGAGFCDPPRARAGARRRCSSREPVRRRAGAARPDRRSTRPGRTTLDAWLPDLEGRLLAYQVSAGGDEQSVLHVLDVTTGDDGRAADRPLPLLVGGVAAGRAGVLLRPDGRPGRGAAGRAGVPPPHLAPPRRHPDRARTG